MKRLEMPENLNIYKGRLMEQKKYATKIDARKKDATHRGCNTQKNKAKNKGAYLRLQETISILNTVKLQIGLNSNLHIWATQILLVIKQTAPYNPKICLHILHIVAM